MMDDKSPISIFTVEEIKKETEDNDESILPDTSHLHSNIKIEPLDVKVENSDLTLPNNKNESTVGEMPLLCQICNKAFPTFFVLKLHERIHMKDKGKEVNFHHKPNSNILFEEDTERTSVKKRRLGSLSFASITHEVSKTYSQNLPSSVFSDSDNQVHNNTLMSDHELSTQSKKIESLSDSQLVSADNPHVCSYCKMNFLSQKELKDHERAHTGLFHCDLCDKQFFCRSFLNEHIYQSHSTQKPHQCTFCELGFKLISDLTKHVKRIHRGCQAPHLICTECGASFETRRLYNNHFNKLHKKKVKICCHICKKEVSTRRELVMHISTIHPSEKPTCEVCGFTFKSIGSMHTHFRRYHMKA